MTEEPTIDHAVESLMALLEQNVLRELVKTSHFEESVVGEAEQLLHLQEIPGFAEATADARARLEVALREWIDVAENWTHRSSSN